MKKNQPPHEPVESQEAAGSGSVSRRGLLKAGAAAGLMAAGGIALSMTAGKAQASTKPTTEKWDETHDVVIIGSGFAGLAAAIQAKKLGAKDVVVYDKMAVFGGNSAINGGLFAAPSTPLQMKEGVKDSPDQMVSDMVKSGRGIAYVDLLKHVAANAADALQLTIDAGAEYLPYLQQLGGHSVPRTYQTTVTCGAGITQPLINECRKLGVRLVNRAKFDSFLFDAQGRVAGARIKMGHYFGRGQEGSPINVKAHRGVLIATGGFSQNINLRQAQDPTLGPEVGSTNHKGATGEAMLEMFKFGAVPVHLAHVQSGPWASPDEGGFGYVSNYAIFNFPHSIAVNLKTGKRFMNEIADRKIRADAILENRDDQGKPLPPIMITSYEHADKHPNNKKVLKYGVGWKFDSIEELAAKYNIPLEPLKQQIEEYNGYVKAGVDKQFGKPLEKVKDKLLAAPFTVVRLWPKVHYCQGGVQINTDAQVIDSTTWKPIPGMFAAGEVTGGTHGVSRLGSCSIPECMVMGMTAAKTMMKA